MHSRAEPIPKYLLYGEPPGEPELGFVHVESVPTRAALHNWEMQPHRHDGLHHVLLITGGAGRLTVDGAQRLFRAPALLAVPARVVHGFRFDAETQGYVLTMSDSFVAAIAAGLPDPDLKTALDLPLALDLHPGSPDARRLETAFADIDREFHWTAIGRASAIAAQVMLVLVTVARLSQAGAEGAQPASPDLLLLGRLRHLIEDHFREHWTVDRYVRALGVTASRLNTVCRRVASASTLQLVHRRLLLEAKRRLIYSGLGMGEIAYSLGFEDPAYFSRFFSKNEGLSPLAFRLRHAPGRATGDRDRLPHPLEMQHSVVAALPGDD